jgi:hypothetical protein
MNYSNQYVQKLEDMILNQLLPVFDKYYTGKPFAKKPELDVLVLSLLNRKKAAKVPVLLKK